MPDKFRVDCQMKSDSLSEYKDRLWEYKPNRMSDKFQIDCQRMCQILRQHMPGRAQMRVYVKSCVRLCHVSWGVKKNAS